VDAIKKMHLARGFSDVGYHALVDMVDNEYAVVLGRPLLTMGAHSRGFNRRSLGICFIGNYDIEVPDPEMIRIAVDKFIAPISLAYRIHPDRIIAHRDAPRASTVCPGRYFPMDDVKSQVKAYWR
jgi:hypothetical protein